MATGGDWQATQASMSAGGNCRVGIKAFLLFRGSTSGHSSRAVPFYCTTVFAILAYSTPRTYGILCGQLCRSTCATAAPQLSGVLNARCDSSSAIEALRRRRHYMRGCMHTTNMHHDDALQQLASHGASQPVGQPYVVSNRPTAPQSSSYASFKCSGRVLIDQIRHLTPLCKAKTVKSCTQHATRHVPPSDHSKMVKVQLTARDDITKPHLEDCNSGDVFVVDVPGVWIGVICQRALQKQQFPSPG